VGVPASIVLSAEPLRVCLLHDYAERRHPSMQLYAQSLGQALESRGFRVDRVRPGELLPAGWQRPPLDRLDSYAGRFLLYPWIARRLRADLFHVVDHGQAYLVPSLDPGRTVVTCHDVILLVLASGRLGRARVPRVATRLLRHSLRCMATARAVISPSEQTRRDLADLAGIDPARVTVIPPGLNQEYRPAPEARGPTRARWGLGDGPLVLHVGYTGFYKNVETVLRVLARLRRSGLAATLVRAGERLRPPQRALAARLGIEPAVRDLGPLPSAELAALYASADVLLFPSLYEGFGWPPLEAMASGLPVVSSRAGALPEAVGDAALTAEPEDVIGLSDQAAAVLTDGALGGALRARGLARAKLFEWGHSAARVSQVYERVLEV
jgi:glycosyltransferase involved in cell wall biosynthesis